jgi:hypothetical protein
MRKTHVRLLGAAGSVLAAGAIALSGIVAATAAPHAARAGSEGIEHFQFMSTSATSNKSTVIAQGVFTAGGVDIATSSTTDTMQFSNGTVKLTHSPGTGPTSINPHTCLVTVSLHGTYTLLGGTGAYAEISGHGTFQAHILAVAARSQGRCTMRKPPVAYELLIRASGPAEV